MSPSPRTRVVWLALLTVAGSRGLQRVLTRLGLEDGLPVLLLSSAPLLLGAVTLATVAVRRHGSTALVDWRLWRIGVPLGFVNIAVPGLAFTWGLQYLSAAVGSLFVATIPPAVAVCGWWLLGERLTRRQVTGTALAFAGVAAVILTRTSGLGADGNALLGGLLSAAGVAGAVAAYVWGRKISSDWPTDVLLVPQLAGSAVVLCGVSGLVDGAPSGLASAGTLAVLAGLAATNYLAPQLAMFFLLRHTTAAGAAVANALTPLAAALFGLALLGEGLSPLTIAAGVVVVTGTVLFTRQPRPRPGTPDPHELATAGHR